MTTLRDVELSYSIYKTLDDGLYLVRRTTDGEVLLARPLDATTLPDGDNDTSNTNTNKAALSKLIHQNAARPAAQLLNHENLISIHDELVHHPLHSSSLPPNNPYDNPDTPQPNPNGPIRMLLWDHPDAGTLADLLADYDPSKSNFNPTSVGGFLPESFIWHVALSLLRALQWLHEGVRDTYAVRGLDRRAAEWHRKDGVWEKVRGKRRAEGEWWPVLHRDLRAGNVFLQQPRGVETYGAVKLGGFGRCFVSSPGAVGGRERGTPVVAMEREDGVRLGALRERMGRWKRDNLGVAPSQRPYTQGSELFALGALLYRMMCGRELPPAEECDDCGCVHLTSNDDEQYRPCDHDCVGDVNIDEAFGPLFNYTADLKHLVMLLLRLNRNDQWWASDVLDIAWEGFLTWTTSTEDGQQYRDVFDGIIAQKAGRGKRRNGFDPAVRKVAAGRADLLV